MVLAGARAHGAPCTCCLPLAAGRKESQGFHRADAAAAAALYFLENSGTYLRGQLSCFLGWNVDVPASLGASTANVQFAGVGNEKVTDGVGHFF